MPRKKYIQARVYSRLYKMLEEIQMIMGGTFTEALEHVLERYLNELYPDDIVKLRKLSAARWAMFKQEEKRKKKQT